MSEPENAVPLPLIGETLYFPPILEGSYTTKATDWKENFLHGEAHEKPVECPTCKEGADKVMEITAE